MCCVCVSFCISLCLVKSISGFLVCLGCFVLCGFGVLLCLLCLCLCFGFCLLLSFLCSWAGAKLPPLAQLSAGMRILILTVILAALAAALFPRKEEEEAAE